MNRLLTLLILLATATAFAATTQKLSDLPLTNTLRDAARIYVYDNLSGNRNMTGAALKNAIAVSAGGLVDAPSDGSTYGRKDATWVTVTTGSGGLPVATFTNYTSIDRVTTTDSRLSDARVPATHDSSKHSVTYALPSDISTHAGLTTGVHGSGANSLIYSNDSRLTDSRPASDVSAWAKAAAKPSYTAGEVGAEASGAVSTHAALTTTAAVTSSVLTTPILFHIRGIVKNGSNAGTVSLHATASTSGQTGTVRTGSRCLVY